MPGYGVFRRVSSRIDRVLPPFVAQLAELCAAHPTRAKWVFVPSHGIGRTIGERLVRSGTNWVNLRFITPLDVALRMGAPFLVERGIDPSEEDLGPALMMRLLLDLPEANGYFRPLAEHPTMAQALWRTLRELRMAGLRAADLPADAFASPEKHRELCALISAYERHLEGHQRGDIALVYEEAARHPDWCPIQEADCWTELPHTLWTPLQRTLIDRMPGERIAPRALDVPGVATPRRLTTRREAVAADPRLHPLASLLAPRPNRAAKRLSLFHAGGSDAEIEEVFRRILSSGRSLDDVEIACASDAYALLVWEKCLRYDWPVTMGPGVPAAQTKPGRALQGFCGWIESDFAAGFMRRLLQSGDVRVQLEDLTAGQAARLLFRAQAGWGRDTYRISLQQLFKRYTDRAEDRDNTVEERRTAAQQANRVERLRDWIDKLLAAVPAPGDRATVDFQAVIGGVLAFLAECASRASALDAAAASALTDAIRDLRALGAFRCALPAALRFIRERVEGVIVAAERPRPGHLHVATLATAGYAGRSLLFVVGLEEGRVFPVAVEDPVLLDAERASISPALRRSSDRTDEAVFTALARLADCGVGEDAEVCFSYSSRDSREFRETFPSWLMLQAFRLASGKPTMSYPDMRAALASPKSVVPGAPDTSASDAGWWLAQLQRHGPDGVQAVARAFPHLGQGRVAEAAREGNSFTEYDGYVPSAGPTLDPAVTTYPVSATQLEAAAECPFRHFLRHGLGLRAVEDDDRDRDTWLDPLTRGSELHDIYAALLRRCRAEHRRADVGKDRPWLRDYARTRFAELRIEMPPPGDEVFAREVDDLLADLELFLDEECAASSARSPVGLEVSFGRDFEEDELEELAQEEPVLVSLGGGLKLRLAGRIDRIDQIGPQRFEVIDYKTGGYFEGDWSGTFAGGTRLQHALYGLAAAELLKRKYGRVAVDAGVYYFSSSRGRQERVRIAKPPADTLQGVLTDLRHVIATGTFVHAPDPDACKWCDFGDACGPDKHERAARKLEADPRLATFIRLSAHE
jgi:ATP-dependent helicase/nuclease subunit B